ncbi:MAG: DUF2189 domain-containing protein [Alphaproteobacteria bacterium]|nr:DUF2189 domain-containing protein [Alphaproteobacteria bacterium]
MPTEIIGPIDPADELPGIREIGVADLKLALVAGVNDFRAMPTHVIFLSLIYPVIGLLLGRLAFGYNILPLLYPMVAGFALLGPVLAIGLYELSRRREAGLDTSWHHTFDVRHSPSLPAILLLGGLLLLIFTIWIAIAHSLYVATFGYAEPTSLITFLEQLMTTTEGWYLAIVGNLVGFLFAVGVLMLTVVSFPLLLDRRVSAASAMLTSIRVILKNPVTMALWGLIVAAGLLIGSLPLFFGLAVVLPILGHATWHLYRRVVEPDSHPRPVFHARPRRIRYGAQFPASLFAPSAVEDETSEKRDRS